MNISKFIKDYTDRCAHVIAAQQEKLIRLGCNSCGIALVKNDKIINGGKLLHNPMSLIGVPLCDKCYNRNNQGIELYE